jgi:hypothetical protein
LLDSVYVITMSNRTVRKISNAGFGSINPAKGFRLLQAEASHTEVTPLRRGRAPLDLYRPLLRLASGEEGVLGMGKAMKHEAMRATSVAGFEWTR